MCPCCNRILHGRKVNIIEYEHRWMHERGACDCDVVFPALQQPRLIHRHSAFAEDNGTTHGSQQQVDQHGRAPSLPSYASFYEQVLQASSSAANQGGDQGANQQYAHLNTSRQGEGVLPLFRETRVGEDVDIAVRQPSLFAAEWTKDHAKLHHNGSCKCPVSFESYKPASADVEDDGDSSEYNYPCSNIGEPSYSGKGDDPMMNSAFPSPYGSATGAEDSNTANSAGGSRNPYVPLGQAARWSFYGQSESESRFLGPNLGPIQYTMPGRPIDIQTMHYDYQKEHSAPIVGNPVACGPFGEDQLPSSVEYQQPEDTIAGFPIGAGPEGDSHAGDFKDCNLARMRRRSSSV
ncbi:hypothetical protein GGR50DRAFT_701431 [Xylaria sp. CBS 124048]|nr:hypothetical protein GGR50DRAFT_701431 [Xylaria sp. CBS 124048]